MYFSSMAYSNNINSHHMFEPEKNANNVENNFLSFMQIIYSNWGIIKSLLSKACWWSHRALQVHSFSED